MSLYNLNGLKFGGTSATASEYDQSEPMDIETETLVQHQHSEDRSLDLDQELRQFLEGGVGQWKKQRRRMDEIVCFTELITIINLYNLKIAVN